LTLIDNDGTSREYPPVDKPADSKGFVAVQDELAKRGLIAHCKVGNAPTLRFDAMACLNVALELLRADAAALLCGQGECPVCPPARRIVREYLSAGNPWPRAEAKT
jgi:hypothetical protein